MRDEDESVILVDADDRDLGMLDKLDAHRRGVLHRAFSVMVFDAQDRLLLQRRAAVKYHSAGLWTNTCCGHPRPNENLDAAASRRLHEEMGFSCALAQVGSMIYRAELDNGLIEHELVHVFRGRHDGAVAPDPNECDSFEWMALSEIDAMAAREPQRLTAWFKLYIDAKWPMAPPAA